MSDNGVQFDAKIVLNGGKIKADADTLARSLQAPLDAMILHDCNYFVPIKTGTLQKSAIIYTRLGSGEIIWRTPYARRLYYEYRKPAHQANPNACAKWAEAAKSRWYDKWVRFLNERIQRG